MEDLGDQVAYLVLQTGTPVYSSDEQAVGKVAEVLAAGNDDIFDGLTVAEGFHEHYVKADSVAAIYERGVVLTLDADELAALPARASDS